ncbi:transposase [bacterium]|nr:transposase [bacterium]MBU1024986.1 transposase [bacterium]
MPRIARTILKNIPYHLTQRGNRQQDTFFSTDDRKRYLKWLSHYSELYGFNIVAYCLMTNHIHIVGIPQRDRGMTLTIQTVQMRHTQAVNRENGWKGHLWQSRYFSSALDDTHLWLAIRYVEQNPVRAGIVANAQDYIWSSAACHCGLRPDPVLSDLPELSDAFDGWDEILKEVPDNESIEKLRKRTYAGIPCGDEKFLKRISKRTGRQINVREPGSPRNPDKKR